MVPAEDRSALVPVTGRSRRWIANPWQTGSAPGAARRQEVPP